MLTVLSIRSDQIGREDADRFFEQLPGELQQRYAAYTHKKSRHRSICGLMLLSYLLKNSNTGLTLSDIHYTAEGKPITDSDFGFSISHAGDFIVCAGGAGCDIGIDIEHVRERDLSLFRDYFSPDEWIEIRSGSNPLFTFYRLWVRKEAVLKAAGMGITSSMSAIEVLRNELMLNNVCYYIKDVPIAVGYVAAIAASRPIEEIAIKQFDTRLL